MATVPDLEHHCNSWIAVSLKTNEAVYETYDGRFAENVDQTKYRVLTALQWLCEVNETLRAAVRIRVRIRVR